MSKVRLQRSQAYEIFLHGLSARPCLGTPIKLRYAARLRPRQNSLIQIDILIGVVVENVRIPTFDGFVD